MCCEPYSRDVRHGFIHAVDDTNGEHRREILRAPVGFGCRNALRHEREALFTAPQLHAGFAKLLTNERQHARGDVAGDEQGFPWPRRSRSGRFWR